MIKIKVIRARECTPARQVAIYAMLAVHEKVARIWLNEWEQVYPAAVSRILNRMTSRRYRVRRRGDYLVVRLLS